ncbi:MAG: hypothetical protein LBO00_01875 [Zoogloeaceae bacterium]|jgi:hypothetical protein|nr:hypothetical protein [Zoogloeaceae bacterium]
MHASLWETPPNVQTFCIAKAEGPRRKTLLSIPSPPLGGEGMGEGGFFFGEAAIFHLPFLRENRPGENMCARVVDMSQPLANLSPPLARVSPSLAESGGWRVGLDAVDIVNDSP